jgi:hypothetical protein
MNMLPHYLNDHLAGSVVALELLDYLTAHLFRKPVSLLSSAASCRYRRRFVTNSRD